MPFEMISNFCSHQIFRVYFAAYAAINYKIKGFNIKIFARSISHTSSSLALFTEKLLLLLLTHPSVRPLGEDHKFCALMVIIKHPPATTRSFSTTGLPSFIFFEKHPERSFACSHFSMLCVHNKKYLIFIWRNLFQAAALPACFLLCECAHTQTARDAFFPTRMEGGMSLNFVEGGDAVCPF